MHAEFRKYHALGNDYIVIDPREFPFLPRPGAVRAICDRNMGAGSDGILLGPLASDKDLAGMPAGRFGQATVPWLRIFNPDGSEAEKSGNGLRIFCLYLAESGYVGGEEFRVATAGGIVDAQVESLSPPRIRVDMGEPSFSARRAGLRTELDEFVEAKLDLGGESLSASFVSMGNPHCVIFVDDPTPELAKRLGSPRRGSPPLPRENQCAVRESAGQAQPQNRNMGEGGRLYPRERLLVLRGGERRQATRPRRGARRSEDAWRGSFARPFGALGEDDGAGPRNLRGKVFGGDDRDSCLVRGSGRRKPAKKIEEKRWSWTTISCAGSGGRPTIRWTSILSNRISAT